MHLLFNISIEYYQICSWGKGPLKGKLAFWPLLLSQENGAILPSCPLCNKKIKTRVFVFTNTTFHSFRLRTMIRRAGRLDYGSMLRHWHMLVLITVVCLLLLLSYQYPQETGKQAVDVESSTVPDHEQTEMVALSMEERNRPIEAAIVRIFPEQTPKVINEIEREENVPRFFRWIWRPVKSSDDATSDNSFLNTHVSATNACDDEPLPYTILRKVVASDIVEERETATMKSPMLLVSRRSAHLFCVRAVVPPPQPNNTDPYYYRYQPYPQMDAKLTAPWWDTLMVSALHRETDAVIPIRMVPWTGHAALRTAWRKRTEDANKPAWVHDMEQLMHERNMIHVYEGSLKLPDPGNYEVTGLVEFQGAQWNFEKGPVVPYNPRKLETYPKQTSISTWTAAAEEENRDTAVAQEHLSLPLCTRGDHTGRWLPGNNIDSAKRLPLDRHGKFWAPYDCRYRPIGYDEFATCLASKYGKGISMYGDSNTRRAIKKMITHGQWCNGWHLQKPETTNTEVAVADDEEAEAAEFFLQNTDPKGWSFNGHAKQLRSCYCEDFHEPGWRSSWFDAKKRQNTVFLESSSIGHKVQLTSYKWDGLTYLNDPAWDSIFTDSSRKNATANDIAIFSLGNWDAAYMAMEEFVKELNRLVSFIRERHGKAKKIIYRTAQYYCCRVDETDRHRLLNGPRVQLFDEVARETFIKELNASVWDTMALGEARTWEEKILSRDCPSNHASADVVEIENQILMNMLCNV